MILPMIVVVTLLLCHDVSGFRTLFRSPLERRQTMPKSSCTNPRNLPKLTMVAISSSSALKVKVPPGSTTVKSNNWVGPLVRALSIVLFGWCVKAFARQWTAIKAADKFFQAGGWKGIYATIPIIAGLLNLATNKLAVWMIFSPLEFVGKEVWPRQEGQPGTLFGWQGNPPFSALFHTNTLSCTDVHNTIHSYLLCGCWWQTGIVPAKVKKMGGDIANLLLDQLLDIKEVFSRIDSLRLSTVIDQKRILWESWL